MDIILGCAAPQRRRRRRPRDVVVLLWCCACAWGSRQAPWGPYSGDRRAAWMCCGIRGGGNETCDLRARPPFGKCAVRLRQGRRLLTTMRGGGPGGAVSFVGPPSAEGEPPPQPLALPLQPSLQALPPIEDEEEALSKLTMATESVPQFAEEDRNATATPAVDPSDATIAPTQLQDAATAAAEQEAQRLLLPEALQVAGMGAAPGGLATAVVPAPAGRQLPPWLLGFGRRIRPKYPAVKALLLLYYASLGSIMPYLPVYYHSLGISDRSIGRLGAITPAVTFLVSPLWGAAADRTGRLRGILLFTFTTSVLLRVAMALRHSVPFIVTMVAATAVVNAPVRPLLDSCVLNLLENKEEYGKQRLWGQWGFGLGSGMVGPLLTRSAMGYKVSFYAHALLSVPTILLLMWFRPAPPRAAPAAAAAALPPPQKIEGTTAVAGAARAATAAMAATGETQPEGATGTGNKPPAAARFGGALRVVLSRGDAQVFFFLVFCIGTSSGVIENFAYKRLIELGAGGNVLAVSRLISSLAGIPMFYFSGRVTRHLGVMRVLLLSLLSYTARFTIYASIRQPWWGLPAEALRGVTFAGFWTASTFHAHRLAPPGLSGTMLGVLNGVYGGLGQSVGALLGGTLCAAFGTARAFYLYAAVDLVLLVAAGAYWLSDPTAADLPADREKDA